MVTVHYSTDKISRGEPDCVMQHAYHTETHFPTFNRATQPSKTDPTPSQLQAEEIALQT